MRSTLRNLILASAAVAVAAITANSAMAQSTVDVPFNFSVAGKVLPAGSYTVDRGGFGSTVMLRSNKTAQAFSWILAPGEPAPNDTSVVLRFDETGKSYALRTVQYGAMITPRLDKKTWETEHLPAQIVLGR
jgi:hypothetical protein